MWTAMTFQITASLPGVCNSKNIEFADTKGKSTRSFSFRWYSSFALRTAYKVERTKSMTTDLGQRVALVTGAGTGIGRAIAIDLARAGTKVLVCGRRRELLDQTLNKFPDSSAGKAYTVDLTDPAATEQLAADINKDSGDVDILINNAGFSSKIRSARHIGAEEWQSVMDVNTLGPVILTKSLLPGMIKQQRGDVIMISSLAGLRPNVMAGAAYSAAKAAARAYMEVLSSEVRRHGIRCTTIFPGEVDTPILDNRALPPDADARATMMQAEDNSAVVMTALQLPHRATVLELSIGATEPRDMSADIKAALDKEQH